MKKVIIAFISGALLMAAGQTFADGVSLIGKKVEGEATVSLNGKEISNAVIIDSKSYAPVRDISESFGANVEYERGVITIENDTVMIDNSAEVQRKDQIGIIQGEIINLKIKISSLDNEIPGVISRIEYIKSYVPRNDTEKERENAKESLKLFESKLADMKSEREQYQKQLEELEQKLEALESTK